jgi:urea transporter/murein DD-endopeptidase MepM/ murein hydrolase activator NlpD
LRKAKKHIQLFGKSILGSYSQVFFSDNNWLAGLVLLASFADPLTGLSGLISVIACVLFSRWLGFNPEFSAKGTYSYNALLVGLAMGVFFKFTIPFVVVLLLGSFLTLLLTNWMASLFAAYRVPFLSLPFVLGIWAILLGARSFEALQLSERDIYTFNELWSLGGPLLVKAYEKTSALHIPTLIEIYLKSLGAIFFQYNLLSGLLVAAGLFIYSRIAFSLSILGFLSGYLFCYFVQGNLSELSYSYIGFNYILGAIAIGGFFSVPSPRSYLLAILSAPLTGLIIASTGKIIGVYQLPLYSLPFSLVVILLLFAFHNRFLPGKFQLVQFQQYSPEKNLYSWHNGIERFSKDTWFHIQLPFYGEWSVSQGHDGKITHREEWKYAWDFVVTDETRKTYRLPGKDLSDFFCYNLPVLAPGAGYIINLIDGIEDNPVGDVNLGDNWGNTIIIKHSDYLYSKISHIKQGSFRVKNGDYVHRGDLLSTCGNSGRSPEPHIHFQLQSTPFIGAKTLLYPIAYYVSNSSKGFEFHSFDYPSEGEVISRLTPTPLLSHSFHFIPGMVLEFEETRSERKSRGKWEVFVDAANQTYLYCHVTGSIAYLSNNLTLHYFTSFKGDRQSLLYYFYLGAYKVLLSYFEGMEISDKLPIAGFHGGLAKLLQDFSSPFHIHLKADYRSRYTSIDDIQNPSRIVLQANAIARSGSKVSRKLDFEMDFDKEGINKFTITEKKTFISASFSRSGKETNNSLRPALVRS